MLLQKAQFHSFYGWVVFHCIQIPNLYPVIFWWTLRLFSYVGNWKWCCNEHWSTSIFFCMYLFKLVFCFFFFLIYTQQWNYWGRRTEWINIFPKKKCRWPTGTQKGAQHCQLSGKYKSKPQWNITSHLAERLSSKRTQIANVGEDMEKMDPSYTVHGNVNWHNHHGRLYGGFSKN